MVLIILSFFIGLICAWLVKKYGAVLGFKDLPNERSSHNSAKPKGGGIGVLFSSVCFGLLLNIPFFIILPFTIISISSFLGGDRHLLGVKARLFIHFACSLGFIFGWFYSIELNWIGYFMAIPLSVFMVGTANFYNFMDGIDGIAGVTGIVGFGLLFFFSWLTGGGNQIYGELSLIIAASCLGFLCLNFPSAKVFLGDVGSVLLGFLFACLIVVMSSNILEFMVMTGFLAPFYYDELSTMVVRIRNRESLIVAHRKHVYQLLVNEYGISHWKVSSAYGFVQAVVGGFGILIMPKGMAPVLVLYACFGLLFFIFSFFIRQRVACQ